MSKKFGKFLLFSAVAGAAAYGTYHYLQNKDDKSSSDKNEDTDDDFDDFSEDLDEEETATKPRSYVSLNLDKAEAIATEAFHKAKEVITDSMQQVKDTVKSVKEGQSVPESSFTDLTALNKEKAADTQEDEKDINAQQNEQASAASQNTETTEETAKAENSASEKVEEFFDDTV